MQLQQIGRGECVAAVAAVLDDRDDLVRDAAVRCLAHNPSSDATAKLAEKLPSASGKARLGLLNALAHRADPAAVQVIARDLGSPEAAVAVTAARALGRIGTPEAARALAEARGKTQGTLRNAVNDAYLLHADRLLREGKTGEAAAIYQELNRPEESRAIRLAALQGVLKTSGERAGPMILAIFAGQDRDAQAIAVAQIEHLDAGALKSLAAQLDKLPAASQVLVLNGLAVRGDRTQLPVVLAAARSRDDAIRRAGLQALGRFGDVSAVTPLLEALFNDVKFGGVAADALVQLAEEGVDGRLIAALEGEKSSQRITALIGILERRRTTAAVPALLKATRSEDAAVRASAFAGMRSLAEPKHVPALIQVWLQTPRGKDRDQAEQAIVAACGQIQEPERRADAVLAALKNEVKSRQADLLPLLGKLGGAQALTVIREAVASSDPGLRAAGLAGLCNWPDAKVSADLLKLAQTGEPNQRLQTLQALIRVNAIPGDHPPAERLAMLRQAMELATRDEERKAALEGLGTARTIETLRYVLPYLDHKDLAQHACKAVVELAHSRNLREPNKAEFDLALDRVIALCKDKNLVDRAKQYKRGQ
jgi:HEAT repeat protein